MRKQGSRQKRWSRISCAPTALPSETSGFPVTMSRACDRTIGPRTRTRWCDDENASCSASNHRAPPSASSACMPRSTTHSTCSGILSLAQLSGSSDQMRLGNGAAQPPPHDAEPGAPHLGRKRLNLTMPDGWLFGAAVWVLASTEFTSATDRRWVASASRR
jgi:hypothetical protein